MVTREQQSHKGQVSALGESPKDENQTKTERRTFLKSAGIATAGLCAPGLPKLVASEIEETDKSLNEEIAQLDPEEKAALVTFLKGLWEVDAMLSPDMVQWYLKLTKATGDFQKMRERDEKTKQEKHKERVNLTGQAKVDYFVEKLAKDDLVCYCPPYQRKMLELIASGEPTQPNWKTVHDTKVYVIGKLNRRFKGTTKSFRQKVIAQYLRDVMPALELKYEKINADQEAYDNLLDYLCKNKTTEEVVALTKQIKRADAT